jgi:hypothetical protein
MTTKQEAAKRANRVRELLLEVKLLMEEAGGEGSFTIVMKESTETMHVLELQFDFDEE